MTLRNAARYIQQRHPAAANDPVWHWAKLFEGVTPPDFRMHDLDAEGEYLGHHLFIEAKPVGAPIPKAQIARLVKLAENPRHHVLLVGLVASVDSEYRQTWREACWTWVGHPGWRNPNEATYGSVAEFRAMMRLWFKSIDVLEERSVARQYRRQLSLFVA